MEVEHKLASISGSDGVQNGISTDLSIDFQSRCSALLQALGTDTNQPLHSSSAKIPDLLHHAVQEGTSLDSASISQLLNALSLLVYAEGISEHVVRTFESILLDLCARWLDSGELPASVWEQRLYALASISLLRPDMWK